jgi:hypothetical protein
MSTVPSLLQPGSRRTDQGHNTTEKIVVAHNFVDMTGRVFGHLTVVKMVPEKHKSGQAAWLCQCKCGQETVVTGWGLRSGDTASCGCLRGGREDMTGKKVGRLTVVKLMPERAKNRQARWLCKCECGGETIASGTNLRNGATKSCSCLQREIAKTYSTVHGLSNHELFSMWRAMIDRCENPDNWGFHRYGGYPIPVTVCDRWRNSLLDFVADMGPRPSPEHSVDRYPDPYGNYEPGNCRWATAEEQSNNWRMHKLAEIARSNGVTLRPGDISCLY